MANLRWRVEIEWACQTRRDDDPSLPSLMDCIRTVKGWDQVASSQLALEGDHVLLDIDEMVNAEILFYTGQLCKK
jgi:hypothetical protein